MHGNSSYNPENGNLGDDCQDTDRMDYEPEAINITNNGLRASVSGGSSAESITSAKGVCTASINSLERNAAVAWPANTPASTGSGAASPGATHHIRSSIEARRSREGRPASFKNARQLTRRSEEIRRLAQLRTNTGITTATMRNESLGKGDDPGAWVLNHHESGLITGIRKKRNPYAGLLRWRKRDKKVNNVDEPDNEWRRPDQNNDFRISFAELQRMRMRKLQCKLVKHIADMKKTGREPRGWEEDLEAYIKAIQDYDYMTNSSKLERDPFLVTGERKIDSYVIHSILDDLLQEDFGRPIPVDGEWEDDNQPIGGTRNDNVAKSWIMGFRERIIIAAVAGLFLCGPMWLMMLHNTLYTSLGSTTGFVATFGIVMAWFLDKPKEVMSGTAAYAAVLVVFVGLAH